MKGLLHRRLVSLGAGGLILAMLAGCGGPAPAAKTSAKASTTASSSSGAKSGSSSNSTASSSGPVAGGTLHTFITSDIRSLDPALANTGPTIAVAELLYGNLLRYGGTNGSQLQPNLAKSWKWSSDNKTVTFTLRSGLEFSNGSPLTASDVAFSITHLLDPKTKASDQGLFRIIQGANAYISGSAKTVSGIQVVNPTTVSFTLTAPEPYFLYELALTTADIVSQANVAKYGFSSQHFVGSGAFVLKSWQQGQQITVTKNPHYWWAGHPYLAAVDLQIVPSTAQQMLLFQKGQMDVLWPLSSSEFLQVQQSSSLKADYVNNVGNAIYYLGMNENMAPFNDVRVRQAFNYAVNKKQLVKLFNGQGQVATGVIPSWMPGYNAAGKEPYPYDPAKAKSLLAQAGHGSGLTVNMLVPAAFRDEPKIAAAVQAQLAQVGINVKIQQVALPVYRQDLRKPNTVAFYAGVWATDYPDPQDVVSVLFNSRYAGQGNVTYFKDPKVDALANQADVLTNPSKRYPLYQQAAQLIEKDAPWVFEFWGKSTALKQQKVQPATPWFYTRPVFHRNFDEVWLSH